jgi:hypothetical protein
MRTSENVRCGYREVQWWNAHKAAGQQVPSSTRAIPRGKNVFASGKKKKKKKKERKERGESTGLVPLAKRLTGVF